MKNLYAKPIPHQMMAQPNGFCTRLYEVLVSWPHLEVKVIQIIPLGDDDIVVAENGAVLEIGITKRAYLAIFKEAHTFHHTELDRHLENLPGYLHGCSVEKLREIYVLTIGYMLTTNENYTLLRVHELVTFLLFERLSNGGDFLLQELDIATSLVSSRLKRINKSPSLFLWIKYLLVQLVYQDLENTTVVFKRAITRILKASQLHYANYYAGGLLRTLIRWNGVFLSLHSGPARAINLYIFTELTHACRTTLTDVSLWSTLEVYLLQELGAECDWEYIRTDYNRAVAKLRALQKGAPLQYMDTENRPLHTPRKEEALAFIGDQVSWLLQVTCVAATPYVALLRPLAVLGVLDSSPAYKDVVSTLGKMTATAPPEDQQHDSALFKEQQGFFLALLALQKALSSYL